MHFLQKLNANQKRQTLIHREYLSGRDGVERT